MSYRELDRVGVLQRVLGKQLTQVEAARQLGLTTRQVRRLCRRLQRDGPPGVASRKRGRRSNNQLCVGLREQAVGIVASHYADFGPTLACEKLLERHGLAVSVETVRMWMIAAELWVPRRLRQRRVHQPRRRRPCRGELVQLDGCIDHWFEGRGPRCTVLTFVDDATSELMLVHFCESETAMSYFAAMERYVQLHGKPVALYGDRSSIFRHNTADAPRKPVVTQFGRALESLNIDIICASTPQAKGRVERAYQTLQDRMMKEMRLDGISSIADGNAWEAGYRRAHNRRFAVPPLSSHDAHRPLHAAEDLQRALTWKEQRKVSKNLTLSYKCEHWLLDDTDDSRRAMGKRVDIEESEGGVISIWHGGRQLSAALLSRRNHAPQGQVFNGKEIDAAVDAVLERQGSAA